MCFYVFVIEQAQQTDLPQRALGDSSGVENISTLLNCKALLRYFVENSAYHAICCMDAGTVRAPLVGLSSALASLAQIVHDAIAAIEIKLFVADMPAVDLIANTRARPLVVLARSLRCPDGAALGGALLSHQFKLSFSTITIQLY